MKANSTMRNISKVLDDQHLKPIKFAECLGVSRQVVSTWQRGHARPSLVTLVQVLEDYGPGTWQHRFAMNEIRERNPTVAALLDQNSNQK